MATEVAFAKTFLSLLDSKPPKISPDHIEDPRNYPGSSPYILPRARSQKPFSKPRPSTNTTSATGSSAAPGGTASSGPQAASSSVTVILRSPRNPPFEIALPTTPLLTSLAELKERLVSETSIPLDKIKLLHNKKPVADSKLLRDLVNNNNGNDGKEGTLELGVMVLAGGAGFFKLKKEKAAVAEGGGDDKKGKEEEAGEGKQERDVDMTDAAAAPVAQGMSGKAVLETDQFWLDLKGYLQQRVRDEGVAGEAVELFRKTWEERS
ncbi:hypothetical protein VTI28DRAFT_3356 [Corynascus sepedonium]